MSTSCINFLGGLIGLRVPTDDRKIIEQCLGSYYGFFRAGSSFTWGNIVSTEREYHFRFFEMVWAKSDGFGRPGIHEMAVEITPPP